MEIQRKLTKMGIEKVKELDYEEINYIAHYVADKITSTFLILQEQYNEILAKLLNCKMYYAKVSNNIAKVNYIYEDDNIYIDQSIDIFKPNEQLFHEIIHYLQVVRKKNGRIQKLGLCNFGDFAITGLGINEAIVQYMSSKMVGNKKFELQIYNIELKTISPNFYPLLTNLIEQLIYLVGENEVIKYTMNVSEDFEDIFYNTFEEKTNSIIKNFDKMLEIKNKLSTENDENIVNELKENLYDLYIETQKIMVLKYYEQAIPRINSLKDIDFYIEKLSKNKEYLGVGLQQDFTKINYYEQYKPIIEEKLNKQIIRINKSKQKKSLISYNNKIKEFFKKAISYLPFF